MYNIHSDARFHFVRLSLAVSEVTPNVSAGPAVLSIECPQTLQMSPMVEYYNNESAWGPVQGNFLECLEDNYKPAFFWGDGGQKIGHVNNLINIAVVS